MPKDAWKNKPYDQMTDDQKAVLAVNRGGVEGYGLTEHSKCKRPEYFGVRRTVKVNRLLGLAAPKRRPDEYKLSVYVPLELIGGSAARFRQVIKACGYSSIAGWLRICIKRLFAEFAARTKNRPDAGTSEAAM